MATAVEEIIQKLQRDINCLSDENKTTRRRALEKLQRETTHKKPTYHSDIIHGLLNNGLLKPLLKMFSDPMERCRDLAITIVSECMSMVSEPAHFLPLIIPVIVTRFGTPEISEPSEEIRLVMIQFLTSIVNQCGSDMSPYLHDMVTILKQTVVDPYPEVKKESCVCCSKLAQSIPHVFHQESELLAKPLLQSMAHQHSKVRSACVKTFGAVVQYGSATPINDALPVLAQRSCDPTPSVRMCTVNVIGQWLLDLPDRYSYHHKLIPLLITGINDEVLDIKTIAWQIWEKVGLKYAEENEQDLKDKMDFAKPQNSFPDSEFDRPNLGCRVLIYRNFSKILPAILRDITDWTVNSRIKSSQLLHTLLYHMEDHVTHHIQAVLGGLYRACQDEEKIVSEEAVKSANLIGFYVPVEIWCHLVLPAVRVSAGCHIGRSGTNDVSSVPVGPVQCTGCLMVLSSLIWGCPKDKILPHLEIIAQCLNEPEVGQSEHLPLLKQLLKCVSSVIHSITPSSSSSSSLSLHLFTVLLRILASRQSDVIRNEVVSEMIKLSEIQGMEGLTQLYSTHVKDIVENLKIGYKSWGIYSPDCGLFASLLESEGSGSAIGEVLDDIIPIFAHCIHSDQDPEMRLRFITLLIQIILNAPKYPSLFTQLQKSSVSILTSLILPSCVWRAGRTAAAIRTAVLTGLQSLLQTRILTPDHLTTSVLLELLPQILSCMNDDNLSTRLVSCKVLKLLLQESPNSFTVDKLHEMYSDLLKRLDDSSDDVRLETTAALVHYFRSFPKDYDKELYKAHIEMIYKGLLVHLDDPATQIQEAILLVLKESSTLDYDMLSIMVENVKMKHRTTKYCDELLLLTTSDK